MTKAKSLNAWESWEFKHCTSMQNYQGLREDSRECNSLHGLLFADAVHQCCPEQSGLWEGSVLLLPLHRQTKQTELEQLPEAHLTRYQENWEPKVNSSGSQLVCHHGTAPAAKSSDPAENQEEPKNWSFFQPVL